MSRILQKSCKIFASIFEILVHLAKIFTKILAEKFFRDRDLMFVGKTAQIGAKNFIFNFFVPILEIFPTKVRLQKA